MEIKVRYFASLREALGRDEELVTVESPAVVADVWQQLLVQHKRMPESILCAVNHRYALMDTALADGDELAFFPPETGG